MFEKSSKKFFFRYIMIVLLVAILGMIKIPLQEIMRDKCANNNLEVPIELIHYGIKVLIVTGYYLLGYRYNKILNKNELTQKESSKWKEKILIIIGIIIMEDVLLVLLRTIFDEIGYKVLGLIIYCGLQYALELLIKISMLLCIVSLLINETNNNNLKSRLKIFTNSKIIVLAMIVSIIGGSVNYFLTIYINPFLRPFVWFQYGVYVNYLVGGILKAYVYLYSIYKQNNISNAHKI
ncbi:MAG: hypothetical protein AB9856_03020 [Cellulosilyticaceae bacterium]